MNNLDFFGLLPINAFKRIAKRMTLEGGKQDAPPAPDYTGAANATAAGNLEAARAASAANRVNQYGPNGSLVYTHDASQGDGGWSATTTLTPEAKAIKAQNDALSAQYGQIAQQGINAIQPLLSDPNLDTSKMPGMPQDAGKTSQDVIMSRLQPQIDRENTQSDAQLANQGIMQGSEAYKNAKQLLGQTQNDRLTQAAGQGVTMDMAARNQYIQNQSAIQNQPLNIVNALRTGAQIQAPQFGATPQQATTGGADISGATQGLYNAQLGEVNANNARVSGNTSAGTTAAILGYMAY